MLKYSYVNALQKLWKQLRGLHPDLELPASYPGRFRISKDQITPLKKFELELDYRRTPRIAGKFLRDVQFGGLIDKDNFQIKPPTFPGAIIMSKGKSPVESNMRNAFGAAVNPVQAFSNALSQAETNSLTHNNAGKRWGGLGAREQLVGPVVDAKRVVTQTSGDPSFIDKRIAQFNKISLDDIEYAIGAPKGDLDRHELRKLRKRLSGSRSNKPIPVVGHAMTEREDAWRMNGEWNFDRPDTRGGNVGVMGGRIQLLANPTQNKLDQSWAPRFRTYASRFSDLSQSANVPDARQAALVELTNPINDVTAYPIVVHETNHSFQAPIEAVAPGFTRIQPSWSVETYAGKPVEVLQGNLALKEAISAYQHAPWFKSRNPELDKFLKNFDIYSNDVNTISRQMQQLEQFPVEDILGSLGPEATRAIDHWSNMRQYQHNAQGMARGLSWQQQEASKLRKLLATAELDSNNPMWSDQEYRNILKLRSQIEGRIKDLERYQDFYERHINAVNNLWDRYPGMFRMS